MIYSKVFYLALHHGQSMEWNDVVPFDLIARKTESLIEQFGCVRCILYSVIFILPFPKVKRKWGQSGKRTLKGGGLQAGAFAQ